MIEWEYRSVLSGKWIMRPNAVSLSYWIRWNHWLESISLKVIKLKGIIASNKSSTEKIWHWDLAGQFVEHTEGFFDMTEVRIGTDWFKSLFFCKYIPLIQFCALQSRNSRSSISQPKLLRRMHNPRKLGYPAKEAPFSALYGFVIFQVFAPKWHIHTRLALPVGAQT